jgi:hypothetical protein
MRRRVEKDRSGEDSWRVRPSDCVMYAVKESMIVFVDLGSGWSCWEWKKERGPKESFGVVDAQAQLRSLKASLTPRPKVNGNPYF